MAKKPEPKPLNLVCSVCDLDWEAHGKTPTIEKCVELLKAELAKKPAQACTYPNTTYTPSFYWQTTGGTDLSV